MDIKELLESRLIAYDPNIDLSSNSVIQKTVVQPIVEAFSINPLSLDVREFLVAKFEEAFPSMPVARGSAISDILISASELFFTGYRQELERLKNSQSIANINLLTDDDAEALAANWFVGKSVGSRSSGIVRITVDRLVPININPTTITFTTNDNKQFRPSVFRTITNEELIAGQLNNTTFVFDIFVESVTVGSQFNILQGEIVDSNGISNVSQVTNPSSFSGGFDPDTVEGLLSTKLPRAISERSLVTARGIGARIATSLSNVTRVQVIGLGDPELKRDRVSAESISEIIGSGVCYTKNNLILLTINPINLKSEISAGDKILLTEYVSETTSLLSSRKDSYEAEVVEVLFKSPENEAGLLYRGHSYLLYVDKNLDEIGALITAYKPNKAILNDRHIDSEISLGGRADVYLHPSDEQEISNSITNTRFPKDCLYGLGINILSTNKIRVLHPQVITSSIKLLDLVKIENLVTDVIISVDYNRYSTDLYLLNNHEIGDVLNSAFIRWEVYKTIELDLSSNLEKIYPNNNLDDLVVRGSIQSDIITTNIDIQKYDVLSGDILKIEGLESNFIISSINNLEIKISSTLGQTIPATSAEVFRAKQNLPQPITTIKNVQIEDTIFNYGHPLGLNINNLSEEGSTFTYGEGFVSPSYFYALQNLIAEESGPLNNPVAISLWELTKSGYGTYTILEENESIDDATVFVQDITEVNNTTPVKFLNSFKPYSTGCMKPNLGTTVVTSVSSDTQAGIETGEPGGFGGGNSKSDRAYLRDSYLTEINLFNEMFMKNTRNIFIMLGPVNEKRSYAEFPGKDIVPGDILSIENGLNKGKYVIAEVINNKIRSRLPNPPIESVRVFDLPLPITRVDNNAHHGVIPDDIKSLSKPTYQKVTILKIYGEFPYNQYRDIEKYIEFTGWSNYGPEFSSRRKFTPLTHQDVLLMLNNPVALVDLETQAIQSDIINKISPLYRLTPGYPSLVDTESLTPLVETYITNLLAKTKVFYNIHKPARGKASLHMLDEALCRLYPPTKTIIPDTTMRDILTYNQVNSAVNYTIPKITKFKWGNNLLCLDINTSSPLLSDGEITNWPTNLKIKLIKDPYITFRNNFFNWSFNFDLSEHEIGSNTVNNLLEVDIIEADFTVADYPELAKRCTLQIYEERYAQLLSDYTPDVVGFTWLPIQYVTDQSLQDITGVALSSDSEVFPVTIITQETLEDAYQANELASISSSGVKLRDVIGSYSYYIKFTSEDPISNLESLFQSMYIVTGEVGQYSIIQDLTNNYIRIIAYPEVSYYNYENEAFMLANDTSTLPIISMTSIKVENTSLRLIPQYGRDERFFNKILGWGASLPLTGSMAIFTQRGEKYIRNVTYSDTNGFIEINEPLPYDDAEILARGICYIDREGNVYVGSSATRVYDSNNSLEVIVPTVDTGLNNGGSTRPFTDSDVGMQITLWGLVIPYVGRDVVLTDPQVGFDSPFLESVEDETVVQNTAYYPIRRTIGTTVISAVDTTEKNDPFTGNTFVFEQKIKLRNPNIVIDLEELDEVNIESGSLFRCLYVITDNTIDISEDQYVVNNLTQVQFFDPLPKSYSILGRSIDATNMLGITNSPGDIVGPSYLEAQSTLYPTGSSIFKYSEYETNQSTLEIYSSFNKNNPFNIFTEETSLHKNLDAVNVQSISLEENIVGETIDIIDYFIPGYTINTLDDNLARSINDSLNITIPSYLYVTENNNFDASLTVTYTPLISQLQTLLSNRLDRVVCSDSLAKRMSPAYIGLSITYLGGPEESYVAEKLATMINNAVLTYTSLSKSDFINTLYGLGAIKVSMPITIYLCVEDNQRRIYRRELLDILDANRLQEIDLTPRITSIVAAPYGSKLLGATLEINKSVSTSNFIGSGGS